MGRLEELTARILSRPPEMDFRDVEYLLQAYGAEFRRFSGNGHPVYRKPGSPPITLATVGGRKVKATYLAKIREYLGLEED